LTDFNFTVDLAGGFFIFKSAVDLNLAKGGGGG
jgi:hypothetical protein